MQPALIDELLKKYSEDEVKGFAYKNFLDHRPGRKVIQQEEVLS